MSYSLDELRRRAEPNYVWQLRAAYHLGLKGFDVHISKFDIRDENESNERFRFEKDLLVGIDGIRYETVEVKQNEYFTSDPASFPERFQTVYCYNTRKGRRDIPVLIFSGLNKNAPPLGLFDDGSERVIEQTFDGSRGTRFPVWAAPRRLLISFDEWCDVMRNRLREAA